MTNATHNHPARALFRFVSAFAVSAVCAFSGITASAQQPLQFGDDGMFKIVQFTDTHYKWGAKASKDAIECITSVLDTEQPDLVVFTGDQVYSKGVANSLQALTAPVVERNIPFVAIFGNHDHQFDLTLDEIYNILQTTPGSLMPPLVESGEYDFSLPILGSSGTGVARVLYCMDTHSKAMAKAAGVGGYDWLTAEQVNWYKDRSRQYAYGTPDGTPIPALLFIHIPLPEYKYAWDENPDGIVGVLKEKDNAICCSTLNSGMFAAMKEMGDIKGVFCGHDHDNDFATVYDDILLAYGRYSGGNTVYNHLKGNGARVIILNEEAPGEIISWLRLADGTQLYPILFPTDFKMK